MLQLGWMGSYEIVNSPSASISTSSQSHFHSHHALPAPPSHVFFCRPAEKVAPDLIRCLLMKRQPDGEPLRLA